MTKRQAVLDDDPLDRALSFREVGLERLDLDLLGFHPLNRGSLGISSVHVHEVAWSCNAGVKLYRYKQVDVVRVPEDALEAFRNANKAKCTSDALMPKFTPSMKFALLTKTHFSHAQKLRKDGGRFLMNDGKSLIVGKTTDEGSEDRKIIMHGVLCSVYSAKLWNDAGAMEALMNTDNDDADVEMGEDEIQALGRVESAVSKVQARDGRAVADTVVKEMETVGLRAFSLDHTRAFVEFRLSLTEGVAKCFRTLVFASVCGKVNVNPLDFKAVASLDVRCMWVKVSILMFMYMSTFHATFPPGSTHCGGQFTGRTKATAVRLPAGVLKALASDYPVLVRVEKYVTKVIRHYPIDDQAGDKVMDARRELFMAVGKLAVRLGTHLDKEALKAAAMLTSVKPETRAELIEARSKCGVPLSHAVF